MAVVRREEGATWCRCDRHQRLLDADPPEACGGGEYALEGRVHTGCGSSAFRIRESANQKTNLRVPRTSVRTKRTPGGVRPRRLDWHIDSPPDYAKAPTATTNHQQGRNGTEPVFPRTPPEDAWFRYRLEPISLQILVQFVRTDF